MSDIKRVARDTKHGAVAMSQIAVQQAYTWLDALTQKQHRGRHDTWGAARDRAAREAGLDPSYAKRIWDRWQTMKDVSGGALLALQQAYIAQCEHNEKMAAHHRGIREAIEHGGSTDGISMAAIPGVGSPDPRSPKAAKAPRQI